MWQVAHRSIRWLPCKTASYRCVVHGSLTFMLRAAICDAAPIFWSVRASHGAHKPLI